MLSFVKKFFVFKSKKSGPVTGLIKDEEINAISDEEAKEFLNQLPVESLIDLNRNINEIYLQKGLFRQINGFIACIGKPGEGKSSLCSAYYKIFYGIDKEIFSISNSTLSFTKGLWILKESIRLTIEKNIIKDIIDVEGFQVDDLSTWKYIMIVAFIATDIIIINKTDRMEDVKKILSITWNSLEKMHSLGLPKILKNIWIQIANYDKLETFEEIMDSIDNSPKKWNEKGIKLNSFLLETVSNKDLRKAKYNILDVEDYLEQAKEAFEKILKLPKYESVAALLTHIDSFNNTMNGKDMFNMDNIKKELEADFNSSYTIIKNRKETQLLKDFSDKLTPPKTSEETFEQFINRHNIDLSLNRKDVTDKLSFYKSSEKFDEIYNKLMEEKDFQADPNIFKDQYNLLIEKVKLEEKKKKDEEELAKQKLDAEEKRRKQEEYIKKEEERSDIYNRYQKKQLEINNYFNELKFYEYIDSYSSSKYNIDVNYQYENNLKNEYNHKIEDYYYKKKEEKKQQWQNQITEADTRTPIQSHGVMECVNGHKFSGNGVGCGSCKEKGIDFDDRLLFWVDVDEHYGICKHCNVVRKISENIECGICGGLSLCRVKFIDRYIP